MQTVRIQDLPSIPLLDGALTWRPVRRELGVNAFGVNAYTADTGGLLIEEHDETGSGAGGHEELYVVVAGRARFTVAGREFDAPAGTLVFVDDPAARRAAVAEEDGTVALVVGGVPGEPFRTSPWEAYMLADHVSRRGDHAGARALIDEALERDPQNPSVLYNAGCLAARAGDRERALDLLRAARAADPERFAQWSADDPDVAGLRDELGLAP